MKMTFSAAERRSAEGESARSYGGEACCFSERICDNATYKPFTIFFDVLGVSVLIEKK